MKDTLIFTLLLALLGFGGGSPPEPIRAQNQEKPQEILHHEVTVAFKLVQIYVIDKKGNPVTDLGQSDFEIYDNDELKPLGHFEKHVLSLPSETAQLAQPQEVNPPAEPAPKLNRKFFLFFDFAFNDVKGVARARQAAFHFLDTQLASTDEVGVISYSPRKGFTVHEYLTQDHRKIRQVVEGLGLKEGLGRAERLENFFSSLALEKGDIIGKRPGQENNQENNQNRDAADFGQNIEKAKVMRNSIYKDQISRYISVLNDVAKALRYVPGSKNIIFFSSGIARFFLYGKHYDNTMPEDPYASPEAIAAYSNALEDHYGDPGLRSDYEKMAKELRASNCSVYALNVGKAQPELSMETSDAGSVVENRDVIGDDSLKQLSKETGGKYFSRTMDYKKAIEAIQKVTSAYYVLGYAIDEKWDGKYHKIQVKVKRKGCEIYGQGGYFSPKPFKEYTEFEKLLHIIDLSLAEKPEFQPATDFPIRTLPVSVNGNSFLVLLSQIPKDKLAEVSAPKMEVLTLVFDDQNNIRELRRNTFNFRELTKEKIVPYAVLNLAPGNYECRLVFRNMETGKGARATSLVSVPKSVGSGLKVFPPLLLVPETSAQYLASEKKESLTLASLYPFDTSRFAPLVDELPAGASKLFAIARATITGVAQPELALSANLIHLDSGEQTPLSLSILSQKQENSDVLFFIEFPGAGLKPGKYSLFLFIKEKNGPASAYTTTSLTVK